MADNTNAFAAQLADFHRALYRWYETEGRRDLPWRNTSDPYAIYISEIMLQQTQVKTVLERYYEPFLKRFPTLAALAAASREEVVKQWEGLGYYNRAANLHATAKQSGGVLPNTVEALMELPGIGRNTASAIAAFAFGIAVPVMEANVKRVLCRAFALRAPDKTTLWDKAVRLLDSTRPFDYNQAIMDVGSLICTKRNPRCGICPLKGMCKGQVSPEAFPAPKMAKQVPVRRRLIVAFYDAQGRYYLTRRDTRFLNGMYSFREYDAQVKEPEFLGRRYKLSPVQRLGHVTQVYSHFALEAEVYRCPLGKSDATYSDTGMRVVALGDLDRYPLSGADRKIAALLEAASLANPRRAGRGNAKS